MNIWPVINNQQHKYLDKCTLACGKQHILFDCTLTQLLACNKARLVSTVIRSITCLISRTLESSLACNKAPLASTTIINIITILISHTLACKQYCLSSTAINQLMTTSISLFNNLHQFHDFVGARTEQFFRWALYCKETMAHSFDIISSCLLSISMYSSWTMGSPIQVQKCNVQRRLIQDLQ